MSTNISSSLTQFIYIFHAQIIDESRYKDVYDKVSAYVQRAIFAEALHLCLVHCNLEDLNKTLNVHCYHNEIWAFKR